MSNNIIVAIELGSHQVTAVVGRKEPDGAINVMAVDQEPSNKFIQRGRIYNPDKMSQCLRTLVERLEKKTKKSINQVYVGVGGMGMHSVTNQVARVYNSPTKITQEIIDSMLDENLRLDVPGYEILDVIPQEYRVGAQLQLEPVGVMANRIEGTYVDIVNSTAMREMVESSFRSAQVPVADLVIVAERLSDGILSDSEKRTGCVFVDMGADTTTVAVYNNNLLRYLSVLPIGGANVTRDIMSVLAVEESEAEEIKLKYGTAFTSPDEDNVEHDDVFLRDGRVKSYREVVEIVEARMEEVLQNVAHQIELSGYKPDQLIGGIVLTGGTSQMPGVEQGLALYTKVQKMRFVQALPTSVRFAKSPEFNQTGVFNAALCIIENGTEECCGDERKPMDMFETTVEEPAVDTAAQESRELAIQKCSEMDNLYAEIEEYCDNRKISRANKVLRRMKALLEEIKEDAASVAGDTEVQQHITDASEKIEEAQELINDSKGPSLGKSVGGFFKKAGAFAAALVTDEDD